jgi:acetyl-CoA/propionyl-CoA carboxylase biotin carboxyl carrier protein
MTILVDGEAFTVEVEPAEEAPAGAAAADPRAPTEREPAGPERITAPMPGTILDVAVQAGDRVQGGQTLCALEAMKMKSPIRAPRAGTVHRVEIHDGQTVDHGDLLFVVG